MIPKPTYVGNLELCRQFKNVKGCVVECGVWRGGMIAGIAEILDKEKTYFLFDSFEGLPDAKEVDGEAAIAWQHKKESFWYFDNCKADIKFANEAMTLSGAKKFEIGKGWFSEILPNYKFNDGIAILRLDGDWYDSTTDCLNNLYPYVSHGGLIIIDDYYMWDGCSKAVHDYFSTNHLSGKIRQSKYGICYIVK